MMPEQLFFKYAYPCSTVLLTKGKISQEKHESLKKMFETGGFPSSKELENIYVNAIRRMKIVAEKLGKDSVWENEVIRKYFIEEHNDFIEIGDGEYKSLPPELCDICKVRVCDVLDRKGNILTVKQPEGRIRKVYGLNTPLAKKGDKVTVHYAFSCEVV